MNLRPNSDFVLVRKCFNPDLANDSGEVWLHLPDTIRENTNWVEIVAIGPKCKVIRDEDVGSFLMCPDSAHEMFRVGDKLDELFILRERDVVRGGVVVRPLTEPEDAETVPA